MVRDAASGAVVFYEINDICIGNVNHRVTTRCSIVVLLFAEALRDCTVGVDASVAEERPEAAGLFLHGRVDIGNQDFFLVV
ncbi:MAG: hypothetical protein FWD61_06465 [Phycisphaerales bacterium]|nr:hypothetical protein [Phycisphaerales bacterium]